MTRIGVSGANNTTAKDVTSDNYHTLASYTYDTAGNIRTKTDESTTHNYTYGDAQWRDLLTARHVAGTQRGSKKHMSMKHLEAFSENIPVAG